MKKLTSAERVCATLLFYFQSGMDARRIFDDGGDDVGVRAPEEKDLQEVLNRTPVSMWNGAMPLAEGLVTSVLEEEPRDVLSVFKDAARTVRRGKQAIDALVGPGGVRPLHETLPRDLGKWGRK